MDVGTFEYPCMVAGNPVGVFRQHCRVVSYAEGIAMTRAKVWEKDDEFGWRVISIVINQTLKIALITEEKFFPRTEPLSR